MHTHYNISIFDNFLNVCEIILDLLQERYILHNQKFKKYSSLLENKKWMTLHGVNALEAYEPLQCAFFVCYKCNECWNCCCKSTVIQSSVSFFVSRTLLCVKTNKNKLHMHVHLRNLLMYWEKSFILDFKVSDKCTLYHHVQGVTQGSRCMIRGVLLNVRGSCFSTL